MRFSYRFSAGDNADRLLAALLLFVFFPLPVFMSLLGAQMPAIYDVLLFLWFKFWHLAASAFFWMLPLPLDSFESWLPALDGFMAVLLLPPAIGHILYHMRERELLPVTLACGGASMIWTGKALSGLQVAAGQWEIDYSDISMAASSLMQRAGLAGYTEGTGNFMLLAGEGLLISGLLACLLSMAYAAFGILRSRQISLTRLPGYVFLPALAVMLWQEAWAYAAVMLLLMLIFNGRPLEAEIPE